MSTRPLPAGGVAVIDEALLAVKAAEVPPNDTPLVVNPGPVKPAPWIVTVGGPPLSEPELGLTDVTMGRGCCTMSWSLADVAEVPPGVITSVSYWPAAIDVGRLIVRSESSTKLKQSGAVPLEQELVSATVGPVAPSAGTRSTSLTALTTGGPGIE